MKKNILKFLLLIFPIFAFTQEYFVEIEDSFDAFDIKIRAFENQNISRLILVDHYILEPKSNYGLLILIVEESHYCKRFIESNGSSCEGSSFTFYKGLNLPDGKYHLYINDDNYGFIYISEDSVYFDPINCI